MRHIRRRRRDDRVLSQNKTAKLSALCDGETHILSGVVSREVYAENFGAGYYIETSGGGIYLETEYPPDISVGDEINFSGVFSPLTEDTEYLRSKGIFLECAGEDIDVIGYGTKIPLTYKINSFFDGVFREKLTPDAASLAGAMFLGNKESAAAKTKLAFRRTGLSHLLALSGLHLSIIAAAADFLLSAIKLKKRTRTIILIILVSMFAAVTGLSASVFRATIMIILFYSAQLFGEKSDSVTALFAALAIILLVRPYAAWDAGLWMSFSATLGLVCFSDAIKLGSAPVTRENYSKKRKTLAKIANYFVGLLLINVVATLFTLPLTYFLFGGISLISPVSNLLVVPLSQIFLWGLLLLCAMFWFPGVSAVIAGFCDFIASLTERLAEAFSSIEGVYISIKYPFTPYIIGFLLLCAAAVIFVPKLKKKYIFLAALCGCVAFAGCLAVYSGATRDELYTVCVSAGQNDAVGFVYHGKSVVLDMSAGGFSTPYTAITETGGRKADELDMLVLTHLHKNHVRTLEKLTGYVKLDSIAVPYPETDGDFEIIALLAEVAEKNKIEINYYDRSSQSYLDIDDMTVNLPMYRRISRSAHPVISFDATLGGNPAFAYVGSSLWECAGSPRSYDSTVIFFGVHGPKLKSAPKEEKYSFAECLLFSGEDVAEIFGTEGNLISDFGGTFTLIIEK